MLQIHDRHVRLKFEAQCVTMDPDLQARLEPTADWHLDACLLRQPFHQLEVDREVLLEQLLLSFRPFLRALQLSRDKSFQNRKLLVMHY